MCGHLNATGYNAFKRRCLFLTNLQNEIQDIFLSFELSTLGSERVNRDF